MVFGSPEIGSLDDDTVVAQYFKGRGNYCTKCFRLHRTCYADNMGLALLEDWLSVEDNRAEWNIRLAASCVLRQTGSTCVQLKDIVLMAQQFHQMAQILSLPSRPFQVVPLELYVASETSSHEPLSMDRVINIAGGDGSYSLGVMMPIQVKGKPALMDQGPGPCVPALRRELLLPTASQQRFLEEVLRENSSMVVDAKFSDDQLALVPATQGTSSKSDAKLHVCSNKLKAALEPLGTTSWPQMKESALRLHIQKLQTVEGEARASGDQELASRVSSLLDGALAVKQFLGRHREFAKSSAKTQTQRCEEICTDLVRVEEFLVRLGQPAAASLKLFARKAQLVSIATRSLSARTSDALEWVPPLDRALSDFIDGGIVEVLTARAKESRGTGKLFNVSLWLDELVKETLCLLLVQKPTSEPQLEAYRRQFEAVAKNLARAQEQILLASGATCDDDGVFAASLGTFFENVALGEKPSCARLRDSLCFLEKHMPKATWTAWRQAPELEALHKRAERVMERSAKDTIADQRFEAAVQYVEHGTMPKVRRTDEVVELSWGTLSFSAKASGLLQDSAEACFEALTSWSPLRAAEMMEQCIHFVSEAAAALDAIDMSASTQTFILVKQLCTCAAPAAEGAAEDFALQVRRAMTAAHTGFVNTTCCTIVNGDDFQSLVQKVEAYAEDKFDAKPYLSELLPRIRQNSAVRDVIVKAVGVLNRIARAPLPRSTAEALEDFENHWATGTTDESFIAKATLYQEMCVGLRRSRLEFGADLSETSLVELRVCGKKAELQGLPEHPVSAGQIMSAGRSLAELEWIVDVEKLVKTCVTLVYDRFTAALQLDAVQVQACSERFGLDVTIELLASVEALREESEALGRSVFAKTRHEVTAQRYLALLERMLCNLDDAEPPPFKPLLFVEKEEHPISWCELQEWLRLHAQITHVATSVAFVHDAFVGPSKWTSTDASTRVDTNFIAAMQHAKRAHKNLYGVRAGLRTPRDWKPRWPAERVEAWETGVAEWLARSEHLAFEDVGARVKAKAERLAEIIPSTEPFVNTDIFLGHAAKKALLQNKNRRAIAELSSTLYADIQDATSAWNALGHTPESLMTTFPAFVDSSAVSTAADKVVDIIACVACLYEQTGVQQKEQARWILDMAHYLFNPLLEKLREVAGKTDVDSPPPPKAMRRRRVA